MSITHLVVINDFFLKICNIFNNREIAIGIWIIFIFILALTNRNLRKSIKNLIKAFFKIIIPILIIAFYGFGIVKLLQLINYWNPFLLKDTIIWYCLTGFVMSIKYITSKDDSNLVRRIIIDNIELIIIFEFIVNIYVFPLWAEIVFLPLITFSVLLDVFSSKEKKYKSILKFLRIMQFIIGLSIFIYSIYHIVNDFSNFGSIDTLKDFLLPVVLTITFIPLIYFMVIYSKYELFFNRLNFYYKNNKSLRRYIKKRIFKSFFLNYKKIKIINSKWMNFKNRIDVDNFIKTIKNDDLE